MIKLSAFSDEAGNTLQEQISALNRNGISYMEIRSVESKNVLDFSNEECKAYLEEMNDFGVSVWAIGSPIGKVDIGVNFLEYKDKIKRICEIANLFKTDKIRSFSFHNAYSERNKVIDYLSQMVEIGNEYGVKFCHENEKGIYGDTLERVVDVLDSVSGLKCVYDPANFIQCSQSADKTLEKLHKRAEYFHIKDVISATGQLVPAGYGDGKIDKLICDIQGDKVLTLEPHLAVFKAYASIDNTEMKHKFTYKDSNEAFDSAVSALKNIIINNGYKEVNGEFIK